MPGNGKRTFVSAPRSALDLRTPGPRAAEDIRRGTMRLLAALGLAPLAEVPLPDGRRLDVLALAPEGSFWAVEIKSVPADFRADRKWPEYRRFADRFFFAVGPDFPLDLLPADTGLVVADGFAATLVREAPLEPLPPARRRALLLRFARLAAGRLLRLADPFCEPGCAAQPPSNSHSSIR